MSSFKQSAIKILREAKEPLHYEEITKRAIQENLIETSGATPENTMNAQITTDIKLNKEKSPFEKSKRGYFKLNPNYNETEQKVKEKIEQIIDEEESLLTSESRYVGKAGEYRVVSELIFRGYNANIISVDDGIDIVATKNDKLFNIQVKTSNENSRQLAKIGEQAVTE